jgi:predicted signal transduction protein with EAL and GGDEF domain
LVNQALIAARLIGEGRLPDAVLPRTRFLFPRSFQLRVFTVCFGAVHLPLLAFCVTQIIAQAWDWRLFLPLLGATLIGTAGSIAALSALLAPITHATALLGSVQRGEPIQSVPLGGEDLVGALLTGVSKAAAETSARIDRLADAAERDMLTGLFNRRGFIDSVVPLLKDDRNSVVAMIDLDHFKSINDRFGHHEGDRVSVHLGRAWKVACDVRIWRRAGAARSSQSYCLAPIWTKPRTL